MEIHFLGGATTVTGSQFLLVTERARVLIDCGMFQGSPNEAVRNRVPFGFDPASLDAILLTHAHLDHCGLIPHVVDQGFRGPVIATHGTCELAELVLLDSGRLQEEFAKREARWERKHPDRVEEDDRKEREAYEAALNLAENPDGASAPHRTRPRLRPRRHRRRQRLPSTRPQPSGRPARTWSTMSSAICGSNRPSCRSTSTSRSTRNVRRSGPLEQFKAVDYDEEVEVAPGIHAEFLDAGHILGSAIVRVRASDREGDPERTIVFSGDLGRPGTPIIRDPTVLTDADYVLVESTYGGREHEPHDEAIRVLADTVRLVAAAKGVLLVPSFAIGRTQEVVWELDRLIDEGAIPLLPLYLDSPMASKASEIYRRHVEYFDEQTANLLRAGGTPLEYPDERVTRRVQESQAIAKAPRPYMIVASNGMLTGGRVVGHLRNLIGDPDATILFVGYQGEGTLGAHLQAGATEVKIDGQLREVRCQIRSISGFSAHADESELLDWLANFARGKQPGDPGFPRRVFLVHGDPEAQIAIEPKVRALGFETKIPHWHERVALD